MNTNKNALHIDYNDFHRLCLDALIAYAPEYKSIHYVKCGNHLRVKDFTNLPEHLLTYWTNRNGGDHSEKHNGFIIDGFVVSQLQEEATEEQLNTPPPCYTRMMSALFPELTDDQSAQDFLYKMHIDNHKDTQNDVNYKYSYKSFKEIFEFLKTKDLIVPTKHLDTVA